MLETLEFRLPMALILHLFDSDDYVGIHYIETLVKAIEDGKASVSICDYNNVYDDMGSGKRRKHL